VLKRTPVTDLPQNDVASGVVKTELSPTLAQGQVQMEQTI